MNKSTVLTIALAGTSATSLWLWHQWRAEQSANLELRARVATLEQARRDAPVGPPLVANSAPPAPNVSTSVVESTTTTSSVTAPPRRPGEGRQTLMRNPEYRAALRKQQLQEIENAFHDLPRVLNLSPEQAARLFELMADQGIENLELQWGWPASGKQGQSVETAIRELKTKHDAQLGELVGERNLTTLKEYRSTLGSRQEVDALRGELARTSEPLRDDQVDPMIAVVYAEEQRMNQELKERTAPQVPMSLTEYEASRVELAIAANQRIVESSRMLLTDTQLAAVKEFYRRQQMQMEAQREMRRMQDEAALASPALTTSN